MSVSLVKILPIRRLLLVGVALLGIYFVTPGINSAHAQAFDTREELLEYLKTGKKPQPGPADNVVDKVWRWVNESVPSVFDWATWPLRIAVTGILQIFISFEAFVLRVLGALLNYVLAVSNFSKNEIVVAGWTFTRDALNFFFILSLLGIAFATIAGIESYGMKRLLPQLIFAALLVNFSLAIAGVFVDFSRVLMDTLTGGAGGTQGTQLSVQLQNASAVGRYFNIKPKGWLATLKVGDDAGFKALDFKESTEWADILGMLIGAIVLMIVLFALGAVTIMLLIRVVALYILLILSPAGFVFSILPQTAGYAKTWWDTFIKYVLYGPVVVFFLMLAVRIGVPSPGTAPDVTTLQRQLGTAAAGSALKEKPEFYADMVQTLLVVLFIIAALIVAQKMGIAGAGVATAVASGIGRTSRWATTSPLRAAWAGTGQPFLDARKEAKTARAKERLGGLFGRAGTAWGAGTAGRTREALQQRRLAEDVKDMETRGVSTAGIIAGIEKGKPPTATEAAYLHKKEALKKPEHFEAALSAVKGMPGNSYEEIGKAYQKVRPVAATTRLHGAKKLTGTLEEEIQKAWNKLETKDVTTALEEKETLERVADGTLMVAEKHASAILDSRDVNVEKYQAALLKAKKTEGAEAKIRRVRGRSRTGGGPGSPPPEYTI